MKYLFSKILNNQFYKDIGILASGSVFGQLILVLMTPLITRIYSPVDFGVYAIYAAISSIMVVFTTGRYEFAIALPKSQLEARNILRLIFGIGISVAFIYLIFIIIYVLFSDTNSSHFQYFINNYIYFLPVSALLAAIGSGLNYMVQREKMYKVYSLSIILQNIFTIAINISIGLFVSVKYGLVFGLISGQLFSILFLFYSLNFDISIFKLNYKLCLTTAKKYINFPKFMLVSDIAVITSQQLTPIFFSFLFNTFIVGNFSIANRFIRIPAIVLTSSIANVFRNDSLEQIRKSGNCNLIFKYTFKRLLWISIITFIPIALVSPFAFHIIFGDEWIIAGKIAQIISIMMIFEFIAIPFNSLYYIYDKQKLYMKITVANTFTSIIMLFLGNYLFESYVVSIIFYSVSNIIFNCMNLLITNNISKKIFLEKGSVINK